MKSLVSLALAASLLLLTTPNLPAAQNGATSAEREQMKQRRKEAAHRKRRVIFNNDGDDVVAFSDAPTAAALLKVRTAALAGSQVDAIFYCSTQSFGMSLHNTKVGQVQTRKVGIYAKNIVPDLIAQGTDALKIMVDFGHRHGMEVFYSMRMNDTHDANLKVPEMWPQFKEDHRGLLFGTPEKRPKYGAWSGVDYARPEAREQQFRTIREVCQNYDVDGIELDFFRHPILFKSHAWNRPVSEQERDMMTGLLRRVRTMTEEVSMRRGRPILIAVRVPDSVGYCKAIGLDLTRWLEEDLVDLLIAGGYFRLSPWEETVALGRTYGVPVYPSLDESRVRKDTRKVRNSIEAYRGRAMNCFSAGAAGIYLFNLFNPTTPHWRELGDPQRLERLDKIYFVAVRGAARARSFLADGERFATAPTLTPERPAALIAQQPYKTAIAVGENVLWGKQQGITAKITLSIEIEGLTGPADISVTLNGTAVGQGARAEQWIDYEIRPEAIRKGRNEIEITLGNGAKAEARLRDVQLRVGYAKGS